MIVGDDMTLTTLQAKTSILNFIRSLMGIRPEQRNFSKTIHYDLKLDK